MHYENRKVVNVKSPANENELVRIYKDLNPKAKRADGLDVSAVRTVSGERGYALLPEDVNRSKDRKVHIGKDFIPYSEIKKHQK